MHHCSGHLQLLRTCMIFAGGEAEIVAEDGELVSAGRHPWRRYAVRRRESVRWREQRRTACVRAPREQGCHEVISVRRRANAANDARRGLRARRRDAGAANDEMRRALRHRRQGDQATPGAARPQGRNTVGPTMPKMAASRPSTPPPPPNSGPSGAMERLSRHGTKSHTHYTDIGSPLSSALSTQVNVRSLVTLQSIKRVASRTRPRPTRLPGRHAHARHVYLARTESDAATHAPGRREGNTRRAMRRGTDRVRPLATRTRRLVLFARSGAAPPHEGCAPSLEHRGRRRRGLSVCPHVTGPRPPRRATSRR